MRKITPLGLCFLLALVASPVSAATINLTVGAGGVAGDHILGEVFTRMDFNQAGGQVAVDVQAVNGLLAVALGTRSGNDPEYYRSSTNFGALNAASERHVLETVARLAATTAVVMVTHRLGSVRGAQRIYVLEQGRLVEAGTWDDLTRDATLFSRLSQLQSVAP